MKPKFNEDTGLYKFSFEIDGYENQDLFDAINKQRLKYLGQIGECMMNSPNFSHPTSMVTIPYLLEYIKQVDELESKIWGEPVDHDMDYMVEFCEKNNIDMYIPEDEDEVAGILAERSELGKKFIEQTSIKLKELEKST